MGAPESFESLARGIDVDERHRMLERLNAAARDMSGPDSSLDFPSENSVEAERDIDVSFKQETLLLKFWLALKSLITGSTQEILYNDHLVSKKGYEIGRQFPELYDPKTGTLLNGMYEQFRHIRLVADQFRPATNAYADNPGEFYVFIGSLLVPELTQEIMEEASPYSIPFDREVTGELRLSLIRKMDDILNGIEPGARNQLYNAAQSIDWLCRFCDLPFDKIISRFSSFEQGSFTCPVEILNTDLAACARVLCFPKSISLELIAALYYLVSSPEDRNDEQAANAYRAACIQQLQVLKLFLSAVPIRDLTCISYNSSMWYPDEVGGAEDWFVKFKGQWRKVFDNQWEQWLKERKQNQVLLTVKKVFKTDQLFLSPFRPWAHVWGGLNFSRDFTLGFLVGFFNQKYQILGGVLKKLAIEGAFVLKENRTGCAELLGELVQEEASLQAILEKIKPGGLVSDEIMRLGEDSDRTVNVKSSMESILVGLQSEVSLLASRFSGTCRETVCILEGVLQIKRSAKYDTVTNLNQFGSSSVEVAKFRELLVKAHTDCLYSLAILREVESIEVAS